MAPVYDFRFAPDSGLRSDIADGPFRATSGHRAAMLGEPRRHRLWSGGRHNSLHPIVASVEFLTDGIHSCRMITIAAI
jgi:hypothetical protein